MKKYIGLFTVLALVSCGGEESSSAETNDGQSSVVATTDPEEGTLDYGAYTNENASSGEKTTIEYMETEFDFGSVQYPSENLHTFKFKNTGNKPLVIESATASCGCTVPNKPEEPILPGEIGELDVIFRPKEGQQGQNINKRVTVVANTEPKQTYLQITANVLAPMVTE